MIRRPVVETRVRRARSTLVANRMWAALGALLARELSKAWKGGGGGLASLAFFLSAAALAGFALGGDRDVLGDASGGILVLAFVVAGLLGLEHMFQEDLESGAVDQLAMGTSSLSLITFAKIGSRALASLGMCAVLSPLAALMFSAPAGVLAWAGPILLVAAPGLVGAGATPAALAAGTARGGLLIAVLTPPLLAPTAILAAMALEAAAYGAQPYALLALLGAASLMTVVVGGLGASAALRLHTEH